jgi:hypothetical protein
MQGYATVRRLQQMLTSIVAHPYAQLSYEKVSLIHCSRRNVRLTPAQFLEMCLSAP